MSNLHTTAYIGRTGQGLGFQLAGIEVVEAATPEQAIVLLQKMVQGGEYGIIFMDETLAEGHLDEIGTLNERPLPSILLLPSGEGGKRVAAMSLQRLMVKAVGSDIFNT